MNSEKGTHREAPTLFKTMAIATFAFGAAIHTLRLVIGIEAIVTHVFLRTALTWSTAYLTAFPAWYSIVEIPMFLALVLMVSRLRFGARNANPATST